MFLYWDDSNIKDTEKERGVENQFAFWIVRATNCELSGPIISKAEREGTRCFSAAEIEGRTRD